MSCGTKTSSRALMRDRNGSAVFEFALSIGIFAMAASYGLNEFWNTIQTYLQSMGQGFH
jgi:Flp pilus assembly pilin Flp